MSKKNISMLMGKPGNLNVKSYHSGELIKEQINNKKLADTPEKTNIALSFVTPSALGQNGMASADERCAEVLTDYLRESGLLYRTNFKCDANTWKVMLDRTSDYYSLMEIPENSKKNENISITEEYLKKLSADLKASMKDQFPFIVNDSECADHKWLHKISSLIIIHAMLGLLIDTSDVSDLSVKAVSNIVNDIIGVMTSEIRVLTRREKASENLYLFMSEVKDEDNFILALAMKSSHDYVFRSRNGDYKAMSDEEALDFFIGLIVTHSDIVYEKYLNKVDEINRKENDEVFKKKCNELKVKEESAEKKIKEAEEKVSNIEEKLALYRKSFLKIGKTDKEIKEITEVVSKNPRDDELLKADYDASVAEMERQMTKLREKLEKSVCENRELLDELKLISPDEDHKKKLKTDIKEIDYDKRYVFVLQTRQTLELEKVLYETFPNCVVTDNTNTINGGCDLAVLFTKWISHPLYSGAKRICKDNKIEFVHCPHSNIEMIKQVIWTYYNS